MQNNKGKLLNVISSDLEVLELSVYSIFFISNPFTIPTIMVILVLLFGTTGLIGIAISILHTPLVFFLSKLMVKIKLKASKIGDNRIKMIQNLIEGIKIVKLYAWEIPLIKKIEEVRISEIAMLKKSVYFGALLNLLSAAGGNLIIFSCLSIHVYLDNTLSAGRVFMLISLYQQAHWSITYISNTGVNVVFAFNGILKRAAQIMMLPDKAVQEEKSSDLKLSLEKVCFSWKLKEDSNEFEDLNNSATGLIRSRTVYRDAVRDLTFNLHPEQLLMVVGPVGCGKSSFFMGLLHEITCTSGTIHVPQASYCSEEPWLISDSIKENILMGRTLDPDRYSAVLNACDLAHDLSLLKHNDETIVGDKGLTLSGGQRARVNLARAIYAQADIYLLDDPLSAVDGKVANTLFEHAIKGFLKSKIVILATHQIQFLPLAEKILVLDHGEQIFFGSYAEMKDNEEVQEIIGEFKFQDEKKTKSEKGIEEVREIYAKQLQNEEVSSEGSVGMKVFWRYTMQAFKSKWAVAGIAGCMGISQGCQLFTMYWPSYWSKQDDQGARMYIDIYGILLVLTYFTCFLRTFPCMAGYINGNIALHNKAMSGLCFAPSEYFDRNQTGWLLNRFSKDVSMIDGPLQHYVFESISNTFTVIGYICIIVIIMPYTIIVIPIMVAFWYGIFKYIAPIIIQLRKIELVSRGPLLSTVTSMYSGLGTMRSLDLNQYFLSKCENLCTLHLRSYITFHIIIRFVQLYFEFVSILIQILNVILILALKDVTDPGLAAFSLSTSLSILNLTSLWFKALLEINSSLASTQRLQELSDLMPEGVLKEDEEFLISEGRIEFNQVSMRYRPELDLVLKNLSFEVPSQAKVGIVGRTGSGKSSVLQVLFRLSNIETGRVLIDGQDYMKAGLHQLRGQMSVIPQSTVLFSGTIRHNLDPLGLYSDIQIVNAIEQVKLKNYIFDQDFGLNTEISSHGISFSAGQKQLLCVARAILRGNKIVMMDEATANVDNETDRFIQNSIRTIFDKCTVLVIAHRLRTIITSDIIIVIEDGQCRECGSPSDLTRNQSSLFSSMIQSAGPEEREHLSSLIPKPKP